VTYAVRVVDTSYLLELYRVPGCFAPQAAEAIASKWLDAMSRKDRFYVPVPVLHEVGNHIAQCADGNDRRRFGEKLRDDIENSLRAATPWVITPAVEKDSLRAFSWTWVDEFVSERIGLTDAAIIHEARRLKREYEKQRAPVHIWTRDATLKAHEPDREPEPFV
jgi:hypothetical protein